MKSLLTGIKMITIGFTVVFAVAFSAPAFATEKTGDNEIPVELNYRGLLQNQPLFQLKFGNTENREYTVTIRDVNGQVLHKETVRGVQRSKYFVLNTEEIRDRSVKFIVTCKETNEKIVYKVDQEVMVTESIAINKEK